MKCEICDRDVRHVYRAARALYDGARFQGLPPLPDGDGRGAEVLHVPLGWRAVFTLPFAESREYDTASALLYRIYTCGDEVCMFRARANGVPGAVYQQPIRRTAS